MVISFLSGGLSYSVCIGQNSARLIALDILPILPIEGVETLQANFLSLDANRILGSLLSTISPQVDVILSDIAANMSGNTIKDTESSLDVCNAVWQFVTKHLKTEKDYSRELGGALV